MDKRRDIQMRLSEKEDAIKGLVDSLLYLKHQIESLEQLKALQGEMNSLKEVIKELQLVNESLPSKPGDLAKDLNDKQERFDALAKKNEDHRKEIESLEKEISEYDETVTRRNTAQEERDSTFQRNEQGLEELMELFIHKTELETSALMMREKIEAIAELVESMG
jgi:chromosome segregation ATPase